MNANSEVQNGKWIKVSSFLSAERLKGGGGNENDYNDNDNNPYIQSPNISLSVPLFLPNGTLQGKMVTVKDVPPGETTQGILSIFCYMHECESKPSSFPIISSIRKAMGWWWVCKHMFCSNDGNKPCFNQIWCDAFSFCFLIYVIQAYMRSYCDDAKTDLLRVHHIPTRHAIYQFCKQILNEERSNKGQW
jgi:hypothetical protein